MPKKKNIKYWISAFDKSEENKGNPKAPKFRVTLKDPKTEEVWEGALFLRKAASGMIYLSGEIEENDSNFMDNDPFDLTKMYDEFNNESSSEDIPAEGNSTESSPTEDTDDDAPF